jgi:hypothetical protein
VTLRDVRPTDDFYRDLDRALAGAGQGKISRADFGLSVLPGIMRRFAAEWDQLYMPFPGRADYRVEVGFSPHLGMYSIEGQLAWDGVIELTSLSIDTEGLIDPEEPANDA